MLPFYALIFRLFLVQPDPFIAIRFCFVLFSDEFKRLTNIIIAVSAYPVSALICPLFVLN